MRQNVAQCPDLLECLVEIERYRAVGRRAEPDLPEALLIALGAAGLQRQLLRVVEAELLREHLLGGLDELRARCCVELRERVIVQGPDDVLAVGVDEEVPNPDEQVLDQRVQGAVQADQGSSRSRAGIRSRSPHAPSGLVPMPLAGLEPALVWQLVPSGSSPSRTRSCETAWLSSSRPQIPKQPNPVCFRDRSAEVSDGDGSDALDPGVVTNLLDLRPRKLSEFFRTDG